jgi:hypothetical protein
MCGFNKMGPPLTLSEPQWLLFEPYSLIASFHDLVIFPGLLGNLKSQVYEGKPRTEELKDAIRQPLGMINQ